MNEGGREALLYDLLNVDLVEVNLREIPKTHALQEQKLLSGSPVEIWSYDVLLRGHVLSDSGKWPGSVSTKLTYDDFCEAAKKRGNRYMPSEAGFGKSLRRIVPIMQRVKKQTEGKRGYSFPDLEQCRSLYERQIGLAVHWEAEV